MTAIGDREVTGFIRGLSAKGLPPKMFANIHGLLSASMMTAVKLGYRGDNAVPDKQHGCGVTTVASNAARVGVS